MPHRLAFQPHDIQKLQPGDCLLYDEPGLIPWLIKTKTWTRFSHVEVYMGHHIAYASRPGEGVRSRPLLREHLAAVVRPVDPFDASCATGWFNDAVGRPYDWWGLFRFFRIGKPTGHRLTCSEFALWLLRAGGAHLFAGEYPPDLVPPGHFVSSPRGVLVWDDQEGWYD